MKPAFWIGLAVLVLGLALLVVPLPRTEHEGVRVAGVSLGVETHHDQLVSPVLSGLLILCGAGIMIGQKAKA